jgi:electron transfer flavoprotein alpha subunit
MSGVLVVFERRGEAWSKLSWEALAAASELARGIGEPLFAAALAGQGDLAAPSVAAYGVERVLLICDPLLADYTAEAYTAALADAVRKLQPSYVLFPHTYRVRDFGPRLAARFRRTMIADVVAFRIENGTPVWVRQLLQGKLSGDYRQVAPGPCFVSMQAGAFRAPEEPGGRSDVEALTPGIDPALVRSRPARPFRESASTVDLAGAPLIVSVGRGIKEKDNIPLVEKLASALGAELAASRPICDNGWLPMDRQVGSSGQTVAPKLYLAVGISGAIQHLVGMKGAKTVIAINKDENAPIFEISDYGVVGDLFEIVPALTKAVSGARST